MNTSYRKARSPMPISVIVAGARTPIGRLQGSLAGFNAAAPAYPSALLQPEDRIDIVRDVWLRQLADTERLLDAFTVQAFRSDSDVLHRKLAR
jgi:hypothetical protein